MVTAVLNSVAHAGETIQAGVAKPVRQVSGVLSGLRAGLETFFSRGSAARPGYTSSAVEEEPVAPGVHSV
jgi:hypothetical protein